MAIRRRPRSQVLRTPEVIAYEELGKLFGRVAVASPTFHVALSRGYTHARREVEAGRDPDLKSAVSALRRVVRELAKGAS